MQGGNDFPCRGLVPFGLKRHKDYHIAGAEKRRPTQFCLNLDGKQ